MAVYLRGTHFIGGAHIGVTIRLGGGVLGAGIEACPGVYIMFSVYVRVCVPA